LIGKGPEDLLAVVVAYLIDAGKDRPALGLSLPGQLKQGLVYLKIRCCHSFFPFTAYMYFNVSYYIIEAERI